jgi:hypothetical protein
MIQPPLPARRLLTRSLYSLLGALAFLSFGCSAALGADAGIESFESNVRPLLAEHCQKCHGPKKQEAGLSGSTRARRRSRAATVGRP